MCKTAPLVYGVWVAFFPLVTEEKVWGRVGSFLVITVMFEICLMIRQCNINKLEVWSMKSSHGSFCTYLAFVILETFFIFGCNFYLLQAIFIHGITGLSAYKSLQRYLCWRHSKIRTSTDGNCDVHWNPTWCVQSMWCEMDFYVLKYGHEEVVDKFLNQNLVI